MKHQPTNIFVFIQIVFSCSITSVAQQPKANLASNHSQSIAGTMPLACYNFSSSLNATFTFTDSANRITSHTEYIYYFDKSSDFFAIKESYQCKNKIRSSFLLEALRDSATFRANLNDSQRTLTYKRLQNKHPVGTGYSPLLVYERTGQKQLINGILCESVVCDNEQTRNTLWVTANDDDWTRKLRNDLQYLIYNELTAYSKGIVMISECYYKQTKHTQKFEVTNINRNNIKSVTTEGTKLVGGF
jgi:hypothetical protein